MEFLYKKHYTREEARGLLPQIRRWLKELHHLRRCLAQEDERLSRILAGGDDAGGDLVHRSVKHLAQMKELLLEFECREIQLKDIDRGLIDFPAFIGGKEVFLCWEEDEEDIEYWHDLNSGYAGREKI